MIERPATTLKSRTIKRSIAYVKAVQESGSTAGKDGMAGVKGFDVLAGVNNLADKRYYTRNVDGNLGRIVGAPRMVYVQGRYAFLTHR